VDVGPDLAHQHVLREAVQAASLLDDLIGGDGDGVEVPQFDPQLVEVPRGLGRSRGVLAHHLGDDVVHEALHQVSDVLTLEDPATGGVHDLALPREDVVILQDVLADLEVARLHLRLRRGDA